MSNSEEFEDTGEPAATVKTVAAGILVGFFDALTAEEGLAEAAARLRRVVLEDGVFAEPVIRAAMFPKAS